MTTTSHPRLALPLVALTLIALVVAACGASTASGSPSTSPSASSGTSASPSTSVEPSASVAPESSAPASADPSIEPVPSFSLPSDDKALEALLPSEICGAEALKLSMSGESFMTSADPEFVATLSELGKTAADVVFAIAGSAVQGCEEVAGVFRIKGADAGRLKDVFLAEAAKEGPVPTESSLGGKSVYAVIDEGEDLPTYAYFNGDAIFFVSAPTADAAAGLLSTMP